MDPTLEQIKTDESVWPDGATDYSLHPDVSNNWLNKKLKAFYRDGEWVPYCSNGFFNEHLIGAIPRPTKDFVPKFGDDSLLPEAGSLVGIYLASLGDILIPHVVKGYRVWKSTNNDSDHHRVFVLLGPSNDKRSGNNQRLLNDIHPLKTEREELIDIVAASLQKADQDTTDLCNKSKDMFMRGATRSVDAILSRFDLTKKDGE